MAWFVKRKYPPGIHRRASKETWYKGAAPTGCGPTRLCDVTLGWMMSKALGLTIDPAVFALYNPLQAARSFDAMPVGLPFSRPIPPDASIANSVALRIQYGAGDYLPKNLIIADQALGGSYSAVDVVAAS